MEGGVPHYLVLQECYNICMAAYKELMTFAVKEKTWVEHLPALGDLDELQRMFKGPPPRGMTVDYSFGRGVVPIHITHLVNSITDVREWASDFCDILHYTTREVPCGVMSDLVKEEHKRANFKSIRAIYAELVWPVPCAPTRKFCFVRFVREVIRNVFAVVDVSTEYFPHFNSGLNVNCKRRPSGVIVRARAGHSEVLWIENMEVPEYNVEDSKYSRVKMNLGFDANRWISLLSSKEKRIERNFKSLRLTISPGLSGCDNLLALARKLKWEYLSNVAEYPNEDDHKTRCVILEDEGIKIWKATCAERYYIDFRAVTTIRVKATPRSVFNFLVKRTPELQWPCLEEMEEPEELVNLVTDDKSCCFTVHAKRMKPTYSREPAPPFEFGSPEDYEYVLQEASSNAFCSFIISSLRITLRDFKSVVKSSEDSYPLRPSGFSIIPDGSGGLLSDASIITMAWQLEFDPGFENDEVIKQMRRYAKGVTDAICGTFTAADDAMEL